MRGGRSNWGRYQQQPPRGQQRYYQAPLPLPVANSGHVQRDVVAFIEGFRAERSSLSTPPNAISIDVIVRAICSHFRVNAFEELMGTSALQLPVLRQLHTVNQRVWTFVTCFMQSRRVNTLFECQQAFLQHEGVRSFHELKIGNSFLHTEAVQTLYHSPVAVMNISTREVLACLKQFETMLGHDAFRASSHIDLNEFLQFLAQQYRQPSAQAMGVVIDPNGFGVYVGMLRRVANQEMKEMKNLEQEFQREVAEKVFQLTKEKFSTDNRQQALEDLLEQTNARSEQEEEVKGAKSKGGGKKGIMQSLSLDMLKRVTDVDVYLDNVLRRKAATDAKSPNKFRRPISSQEIAETDTKLRNQLARFLVSSQKSKHHSRLKVITWVICSIMAKTYALLLSDDKLPDEEADDVAGATTAADESDKEECDCCCVGKESCTCSCSCSCHVESSDEEDDEDAEEDSKDTKTDKSTTPHELPVRPSQESSTVAPATVEIPLEKVEAVIKDFLVSQSESPQTAKDVLQTLSSLETHLTETFSVKPGSKIWAGRESLLHLLRDLVSDTDSSDVDAVGLQVARMMGSLNENRADHRSYKREIALEKEVLPFIRECRAVVASSPSLSSLATEKQQQWIARRLSLQFGCSSVEDFGVSTMEELLKLGDMELTTGKASQSSSILKYASAVDVTRDEFDTATPEEATGKSAQLKLLTDEALAKLRQCPCLVDVSLFMNWQERYAPLCGPLRLFIRMHEMILLDHASSSNTYMFVCCLNGTILRVNEKSTPSDLELLLARAQQANAIVAPSQVAVLLVSMIVTCRGQSNFPKQLVQAHLRAYLVQTSKRLASSPKNKNANNYAARFVLEVLQETPAEFAAFVLEVFLDILATAANSVAAYRAADSIWAVCRTDVERKTLALISKQSSLAVWTEQTEAWYRSREDLTGAHECDEVSMVDVESGNAKTTPATGTTDVNIQEGSKAILAGFADSNAPLAVFSSEEFNSNGAELAQIEPQDTGSCRSFINDLRRKQFGVGLEIPDEATTSVLLIQQQRLERALKRLSDELYSESTHFVLELLQNADDNVYDSSVVPCGEFTLTGNHEIVFHNNERGFSPENIQAICDVGASTKAAVDSEASIGKKGIGFKSVFKVSDNPQVHSNGFHICFHAKNAQHGNGMGYILPYWLDGATQWKLKRGTTFVLPLNDASVPRLGEISQALMTYEPSVLLFLRRIRELRLRDESQGRGLHFLKKENIIQTDVYVVQLFSRQNVDNAEVEQQKWLVVKDKLDPPSMLERNNPTEIALAFPFDVANDDSSDSLDRPPLQQVFAYLPLRSYGFRFILQGDFEIPSSREAITNGSEWNEWLVSKFPKLVRTAVSSYIAGVTSVGDDKQETSDVGETDRIITAISHVVSLLPYENEVQAPFRRIVPEIMSELRQVRWLACASSVPSSELLRPVELLDCTELTRGDVSDNMAVLLEALSEKTLASTFNKRFLHPVLSRRMPPLLKSQLRIEQLHSSHIMRVLSLSEERDEIGWTVKMLTLLAKLWRKDRHFSLLLQELRLIKCFPLQRKVGSDKTMWVSLADGHDSLFVTSVHAGSGDGVDKELHSGGQSYEFLGDLRILDDDFTKAISTSVKLRGFLMSDVGIHVMADHDLIRHHLLPKMNVLRSGSRDTMTDRAADEDLQAAMEYGRFLSAHLVRCQQCPMQADIKAHMVVATSSGTVVGVDTTDVFVVLPSTYNTMAELLSWLTGKIKEDGQKNKYLNILSGGYFAKQTTGSGKAYWRSQDAPWERLLVEVCNLPLLFEVESTKIERSISGLEQVLKWIELEDDISVKRSVSKLLAQYFDKHWSVGDEDANMDIPSDGPQDKLGFWRKYQWLEGSDKQFHCSTDLWLSDETVTRLFSTGLVTYSSIVWSNEAFSRRVLGMKCVPEWKDVLPVISSLSVDSTLVPNLETSRMVRMYSFLWEESQRSDTCRAEVAMAFSRKMLIFIPSAQENDRRFVGAKRVVWSSTAYNSNLAALDTIYPKHLSDFFTDVCGVQRKPSTSILCELLKGQLERHDGQHANAAEQKKSWKKHVLPILSALSKKTKKRSLPKSESREIKKILKAVQWIPVRSLSGADGGLSFCCAKDQPIRSATEEDEKLLKLLVALSKSISPVSEKKKRTDADTVNILQQDGLLGDGELNSLFDLAKIPTLSSHLVAHANTWCNLLASYAAKIDNKKGKKKLVKVEQFVVKAWAKAFSDAASFGDGEAQFQRTIQRLKLFPTIDDGCRCAQATDMYINDQSELPEGDLRTVERQQLGHFSALGLFSWNYFAEDDNHEAIRVQTFLEDFCGMKSLKKRLQHEVSVLSTQRAASEAFHSKLRSLLGLAQRVLFHNHRRVFDQLEHDKIAELAEQLRCVLVDGRDGFQVVYRVGSMFSLRRGTETLSQCFLDVSACTLYVQVVTGDEESSGLFQVLLEVSRKLFGTNVASNVANLLYLSSLQANSVAREQWLVHTQKLPPVSAKEVGKLWVEVSEDAEEDNRETARVKRDSLECLEDGEIAGEELPTKKFHAAPPSADDQTVQAQTASYPPLPPSKNYNHGAIPNGSSYGNQAQAPYPPLPPQSYNTIEDSSYPPLPASSQGLPALSLTNAMTKEEREAIGRWGEEYVFNQLKQQHAEEKTELAVEWVNEKEESGLPYDLTLASRGRVVEYIEVKSTRTMEKGVFEISMNELDQAAIHGSTYSIYRVFNAGNPSLCRVIRMKNPVSLVRQRKIQLALVMQ